VLVKPVSSLSQAHSVGLPGRVRYPYWGVEGASMARLVAMTKPQNGIIRL
jgi:hypothetical protein